MNRFLSLISRDVRNIHEIIRGISWTFYNLNFKFLRKQIIILLSMILLSTTAFGKVKSTDILDANYTNLNKNNYFANNRISFTFQDVPLKSLLQLIAKNSGLNFIISDEIKNKTTLNLKNVTWQQAFNIILKSHGLAARRIGSAIFISTINDITEKQTSEYKAEQDLNNLSPLVTTIINLKYADANNIIKLLKSAEGSLLTSRGEVTINVPTNSIVVRDSRKNINDIRSYIHRLDIPTKQVSIEARIVNIDCTYEGQLGVRFGLSNTRSVSGTLNGANDLARGIDVSKVPVNDRLNFNIPANVLSTGANPASIGLALAHLGPILLDLELSALEEEGHSQIIAKPRVVTANQQKAIIQTGEEIPYQQATSSGATSVEFKKAVLSLEVIPQITPDNKIILKLKATQDSRGPQLLISPQGEIISQDGTTTTGTSIPAIFGPPTINTQEIQSQVLLNNNETVVIGGIYKITKTNIIDRVPFFSSIPLLGRLFKHHGAKDEKQELLIFLTPQIIEERTAEISYKNEY